MSQRANAGAPCTPLKLREKERESAQKGHSGERQREAGENKVKRGAATKIFPLIVVDKRLRSCSQSVCLLLVLLAPLPFTSFLLLNEQSANNGGKQKHKHTHTYRPHYYADMAFISLRFKYLTRQTIKTRIKMCREISLLPCHAMNIPLYILGLVFSRVFALNTHTQAHTGTETEHKHWRTFIGAFWRLLQFLFIKQRLEEQQQLPLRKAYELFLFLPFSAINQFQPITKTKKTHTYTRKNVQKKKVLGILYEL